MPTSWFREEKIHRNFIRDVYAMLEVATSTVVSLDQFIDIFEIFHIKMKYLMTLRFLPTRLFINDISYARKDLT